jgi:hypothetical protein
MLQAAVLRPHVYEEVEADRSSLPWALLVVLLASAAGATGSAFAGHDPARVAVDVVEPVVLWVGGSAFAYMAGATFFRGPHTATDFAEVLRTLGFAFSPGLLRLPAALLPPGADTIGSYAVDAWMLVAGVVAVRQALDFTTWRAIGAWGAAYVLLYYLLLGASAQLGVLID